MAPCSITWACSGVTQSTTLQVNGQSITVCSNYPPYIDPNNCNGTIIVTPRGICINGQCESTCRCYAVQNQSVDPLMVYWIDCDTSATRSQLFASGEYHEICSLNIPSGPYGISGIVSTVYGDCRNGVCVPRPTSDYYAIRVENVWTYLGDDAAEDEHIQYVLCQGFKIYQMYGLYHCFYNTTPGAPNPLTLRLRLPIFLTKLYNAGLKPVAILGAREGTHNGITGPPLYTDLSTWERNAGAYAGENPNQVKFWGVDKENYFWDCEFNPGLCDSEHEHWVDWLFTMTWLRAGFGVWHNWHISCLVDRHQYNVVATFDIVKASQLIAATPDVIEIRSEAPDTVPSPQPPWWPATYPPPPFTVPGTPYPTYYPFLEIVNTIQTACASLGLTQEISVYWNADQGLAQSFLSGYATHGPAYFDWQNEYISTVAPTTPNLDMLGLSMYTYDSLSAPICEPQCLPGYVGTTTTATPPPPPPPPINLPQYSKIFVLWITNRGYETIINGTKAFFVRSQMEPIGVTLGGVHAQFTQSQPNFLAAFAGDNFGVVDNSPWLTINSHNNSNLASVLLANGKTFATYAESIPSAGAIPTTTNWYSLTPYYPWKDPALNFSNITPQSSYRKPWTSFNPATAENVCFLVPDSGHDMSGSIQAADNWLWQIDGNNNVQNAINYCANPANNSLFILYGDNITGGDPRLPVIFIGNGVGGGATPVGGVSPWVYPTGHYSFLKTILALMGITTGQPGNAASPAVNIFVGWY